MLLLLVWYYFYILNTLLKGAYVYIYIYKLFFKMLDWSILFIWHFVVNNNNVKLYQI